jgi:hypothetical protein
MVPYFSTVKPFALQENAATTLSDLGLGARALLLVREVDE